MNNQSMRNAEILDADDVISCKDSWVMSNNTYLTEELLERSLHLIDFDGNSCDEDWIVQQMDCRVLRAGDSKGWRSGTMTVRIEVVVEFEPDVPECQAEESFTLESEGSPLAALRD